MGALFTLPRSPVRICKGCARMAIETIDREVLRRDGEQPRLRVFDEAL
jgi:hypothetical protein